MDEGLLLRTRNSRNDFIYRRKIFIRWKFIWFKPNPKRFFFFRKDGARINKKTFLSMKQQGEKN